MSPEAIGNLEYSEKSDVWSFACVVFEILERREPFDGLDLITVATDIRDHGVSPLRDLSSNTPPYIKELMGMCFQRDPTMRPTFKELVGILESHAPKGFENEGGDGVFGDTDASRPPERPKYQEMGGSASVWTRGTKKL